MEYTPELLNNVSTAGSLGYTLEIIKYAFEIPDWEQFVRDFKTEGSAVFEAYKKGSTTAQFNIEKALLAKAELGDKEAIELLWRINTKRQAQEDMAAKLEL